MTQARGGHQQAVEEPEGTRQTLGGQELRVYCSDAAALIEKCSEFTSYLVSIFDDIVSSFFHNLQFFGF